MATTIIQWRLHSSCYPLRKLPSYHNNYNSRPANHRIICCALNTEDKDGLTSYKEGLKDVSRKEALRRLDLELERGNEKEALAIVTSLQGKPSGLRGFGGASQVPQRLYTLEELRLNKIDTRSLLSPVDTTLGAVRRNIQITAIAGYVAAWRLFNLDQFQLLSIVLALLALGTIDLVIYGGGVESLIIDTIGRMLSKNDALQHEAGHFLIAYLLGILSKGYTLSNLDAFKKNGSLNVQAGTAFVDFQFLEEVKSGKLSSGTLSKYSCIALAGVATEYLLFGLSEGGLTDIQQLDNLFKSLSFTQKKSDSQVRWAVLNTVTLLRRHEQVRCKLAEAMAFGKSVGECIDTIENELTNVSDI
ncbi:uncharacterized protein LOC131031496 isoform X2 [Cryptomeria japonica]|uniref:uncharacterized protein LOC131031496 isoform X2 n=1 Tax=Cryptomeria japonica TaxID=3369 RepID=UPI0025ABB1A4|nr:uncharacterized protein LOC131031496 isoform X2 [Cryptomeria japonica]